jgi:hypothetical protein
VLGPALPGRSKEQGARSKEQGARSKEQGARSKDTMFFGHLPVKEFPQHIQLFTSILFSDNELTLGEYSVAKIEDLAV